MINNTNQNSLLYVNAGKYIFSFRGVKNIPIKGVDNKRQIIATYTVSCTGEFLPIQIIYANPDNLCRKAKGSLPKYSFPPSFLVTFTENHCSNKAKSLEFVKEIFFPYLEDTKQSKSYPLEQHALIIVDTFKGQDNNTLEKLCAERNSDIVIVPHNLTNKFHPLNLSINNAAKPFIQNKYNDWFADQVFTQLQNGKDPTSVKISSKWSDLRPISARWILDCCYNHVIKERDMIFRGFSSVDISEVVQNTEDIYEKIENSFRE